jgi:hypothetical protein
MNANELRACDLCGRGLMHTGVPLFYRLTFERMAVDMKAVRERVGLAMLFNGSAALAEVFAPSAEVAQRLGTEADVLLVCDACALSEHTQMIAELAEIAAHRRIAAQAVKESQAVGAAS